MSPAAKKAIVRTVNLDGWTCEKCGATVFDRHEPAGGTYMTHEGVCEHRWTPFRLAVPVRKV